MYSIIDHKISRNDHEYLITYIAPPILSCRKKPIAIQLHLKYSEYS